jgi:uncharacterized protein (TIGR02145 family)
MDKQIAVVLTAAALVFAAGAGGGDSSRSTFTDTRDGKTYKIVKIGSRNWFAENLNYAAKGSVCYDNKTDNCAKYGRLYNWETALTACPAGTHLPTDNEWTTLTDKVGGSETAGNKLKSTSGWNWNDYKEKSGNGTNDYGFSALPGGVGYGGEFIDVGNNGLWWSATELDEDYVWGRGINYNFEFVNRYGLRKADRFSVRCVQN